MKTKLLSLAVILCAQSALALDWSEIADRLNDAGNKFAKATTTLADKAKKAAEPHAEAVVTALVKAVEDIAVVAEEAADDL